MVKMNDVNTTDIAGAIRLGCRMMGRVFNEDDCDMPFFRVIAKPKAFIGVSMEDHIPGRHLNALLNSEDAIGMDVDEDSIEKHARAAFFSYQGPLALPFGRIEQKGSPIRFNPHNVREGFHALYALVKFRDSDLARNIAEASVSAMFEYWHPETDWDYPRMMREYELTIQKSHTFISGVARAIGPIVKYYRATGYGPALELAIMLKEKALDGFYNEIGSYDRNVFGDHVHSITCVMSSLAQLADLTTDSILMKRVKAFYDNGLWDMRDDLGWSIESTNPEKNPDEGEMNNTGDILETALILGRWGYTDYYQDAERILRCHLLPSQLRDVSFIDQPSNPGVMDGKRDVADRIRGAFGFPAPYGHEPIDNVRIRFNTDVVGGSVGSLCEAYREATRYDDVGHWVNLLFDHETSYVRVQSAYTHPAFRVTVKRPGPLFVRIPTWVDVGTIIVEGDILHRQTAGYLFFPNPPINRAVTINYPIPNQNVTLKHRTRNVDVKLHGDAVLAMENFGADLTFFDPLE